MTLIAGSHRLTGFDAPMQASVHIATACDERRLVSGDGVLHRVIMTSYSYTSLSCVSRASIQNEHLKELPRAYSSRANQESVAHRWQAPRTMRAGDLILFNVKTVHAATRQTNNRTRFSMDMRVTTSSRQRPVQ